MEALWPALLAALAVTSCLADATDIDAMGPAPHAGYSDKVYMNAPQIGPASLMAVPGDGPSRAGPDVVPAAAPTDEPAGVLRPLEKPS